MLHGRVCVKCEAWTAELAPFRASYRLLSYVLSRNGYRVNSDMPGDDRPETVQAFESALFGWAGMARPD
jgi:hypothetical protein